MAKKELPYATHEGPLNIGEFEIPAYNLSTGERVLSRIGFLKALGRTGKAKGGRQYDDEFKTPIFLSANNVQPFVSKDLIENSNPIIFNDLNGNESIGYKAELLPSVCYVFIDADEAGKLKANQKHIAEQSKKLVRGFATVGIIALVDEATGYQYDRERQELQKILKAFISDELLPWQRRFYDDYYKEIFRLNGWDFTVKGIKGVKKNARPGVIGTWTNKYIYNQLPEGVLDELKRKTPKSEAGNRLNRYHQFLTEDIGNIALDKQLVRVITIMKLSRDWKDFEEKFNQLYGQTRLQFDVETRHKPKLTELSEFNQKLKQGLAYNPREEELQ